MLLPTTIYQDPLFDDFLFYTSPSQNTLPTAFNRPDINSIWDLDDSHHVYTNTPEFYQWLIGQLPNLNNHEGLAIAHQLELETLLTCGDGSFYPEAFTGSHGWVLASTEQQTLLQGAGPDDGHPSLLSSYRSELGGWLAVLYTIYCICIHYQVSSGKVTYYCDNNGVLKNVFSITAPGISPYLQTDADLVMEAKRPIDILPITIIAEWVKGHYNGKDREYKHNLNETADSLATSFNSSPHPQYIPHHNPAARPPNYGAKILSEGSTVTCQLRHLMAKSLHRPSIKLHIMKKNQWSDHTHHPSVSAVPLRMKPLSMFCHALP
jgi:hypothetical protein